MEAKRWAAINGKGYTQKVVEDYYEGKGRKVEEIECKKILVKKIYEEVC